MELEFNPKLQTKEIIEFMARFFVSSGFNKAIVGISGGIDSAVIANLCVKVLGKENVTGVMLPYGKQPDIEDADLLCNLLQINKIQINIQKAVDEIVNSKIKESQDRLGNIKARIRMIYLYDLSAELNALVVGTGNKTELLLGYFTHYGDGACAIEPIGHLYKTQVKEIAKYLNIFPSIINKAPSAGLFDGQTDEEDLGGTYQEIDNMLCNMNIQSILNEKFDEPVKDLYSNIKSRIRKNFFKLLPPKSLL